VPDRRVPDFVHRVLSGIVKFSQSHLARGLLRARSGWEYWGDRSRFSRRVGGRRLVGTVVPDFLSTGRPRRTYGTVFHVPHSTLRTVGLEFRSRTKRGIDGP